MDKSVAYETFSRRTGAVVAHHRMWKAPDHLMVVKEFGCAEEYKRFYFTDIQSIVIMRTPVYLLWALLLPVLLLFMVGFMFSVEKAGFLVGLSCATLVIWFIHMLKGPTCKCWLQTGINRERLHMFNRVSAANRFWKRVEPLLRAAQGEFSLEEMEAEGTRPVITAKNTPPPIPSVAQVEAV
ncbi:hypothetical protein PDESU_02892 [Pontiella desulfatans]|uniref:Uncharacterized protein n=1 Tax=Pontiella desulfatans TaxID=2750659 RepID=A0A6C2U367_PONDE|nr:hypothetical protein [Pontiella desulfatans]VGO14333.1 hypothetical protein PDESU_02892 [Pontiella desulfatans]